VRVRLQYAGADSLRVGHTKSIQVMVHMIATPLQEFTPIRIKLQVRWCTAGQRSRHALA